MILLKIGGLRLLGMVGLRYETQPTHRLIELQNTPSKKGNPLLISGR